LAVTLVDVYVGVYGVIFSEVPKSQ